MGPYLLWDYTYYGRYDFFRLQRNGVSLFGRAARPTAGAEGEAKAEEAAAEWEVEAEGEVEAAAKAAAAEAAAEAAAVAEAQAEEAAAEAAAEAEGAAREWRRQLHQSIVRRADRGAEAAWLADVERVHAPALQRSMEAAQSRLPHSTRDSGFCDGAGATDSSGGVVCANGGGNVKWREAPPPAAATLSLLRAIAAHGSTTTKEGDGCTGWPATSIARSRVIRGSELKPPEVTKEGREVGKSSTVNRGNGRRGNATNGDGSRPTNGGSSTGSSGDGSRPDGGPNGNGTNGDGSRPTNGGTSPTNGGSLTVVNVALVGAEAIHVPRANALFPEMAISVFELEVWLIAQHGLLRPPSTHCAVRRNAMRTRVDRTPERHAHTCR